MFIVSCTKIPRELYYFFFIEYFGKLVINHQMRFLNKSVSSPPHPTQTPCLLYFTNFLILRGPSHPTPHFVCSLLSVVTYKLRKFLKNIDFFLLVFTFLDSSFELDVCNVRLYVIRFWSNCLMYQILHLYDTLFIILRVLNENNCHQSHPSWLGNVSCF